MKGIFNKIRNWYSSQSSTTKGMIWLGVLLIIGIIIRWDYIIEHAGDGFSFLDPTQNK